MFDELETKNLRNKIINLKKELTNLRKTLDNKRVNDDVANELIDDLKRQLTDTNSEIEILRKNLEYSESIRQSSMDTIQTKDNQISDLLKQINKRNQVITIMMNYILGSYKTDKLELDIYKKTGLKIFEIMEETEKQTIDKEKK
jgi:uncharacterized protein (DUF3084 family)